ncbi:3-dehydro-L-gulonate 2-dehydrogenase [Flammeovirgaceae bacterium SG7u.111]|nr:3-dehydro-L-gulonate 2-dehydrogenase [Flammeovirgaceae bacterium SG7u.132]WPO33737.1 3-dehydro-L-gulonate 2-dehydrogenase [Flammeovirgaceae bacterium SG7u.111]
MLRIPYTQLQNEFLKLLLKYKMSEGNANICARLFANASLDGVASHGLNRFPLFIGYIKNGYVKPKAVPIKENGFGALEVWDGLLGPGPSNAWYAMNRAMEISKSSGIGLVALRNTNHWMRGGNFGWQAVDNDCMAICWSNTKPNMPAWETKESVLGNNPLVLAIPRKKGHLVWDGAMSQFSFGKVESMKMQGKELPFLGGYDKDGKATTDPAAIMESALGIPMGYWKGAGLALMLDIMAAVLSDGQATHQVGNSVHEEYNISQVFIAIQPEKMTSLGNLNAIADGVIEHLKNATPKEEGGEQFYPGEQTLKRRMENLVNGIPVDEKYWDELYTL